MRRHSLPQGEAMSHSLFCWQLRVSKQGSVQEMKSYRGHGPSIWKEKDTGLKPLKRHAHWHRNTTDAARRILTWAASKSTINGTIKPSLLLRKCLTRWQMPLMRQNFCHSSIKSLGAGRRRLAHIIHALPNMRKDTKRNSQCSWSLSKRGHSGQVRL